MITLAAEVELRALDYAQHAANQMTPKEAQNLLEKPGTVPISLSPQTLHADIAATPPSTEPIAEPKKGKELAELDKWPLV